MRSRVAIGCHALLMAGLILSGLATAATARPQTKVEQSVIEAVPAWHGKKAQIIDDLDLTKPFATNTPWALVVARDPMPPPADFAFLGDSSPIAICFVRALAPRCSEDRGHADNQWFDMTNALSAAAVVFAGPGRTRPLLMLKTGSAAGLNGSHNIRTALFEYDRKADDFRQVFVSDSGGSNNNQAARFVEHGPLQGDVIVDHPTDHAPYTYWIEVYAQRKSGRYARILRYRGHTGYGDGNPLAVADSEMPNILSRLGLWKSGDVLPIPAHAPKECGSLVLHRGEEWCEKFLARKQ